MELKRPWGLPAGHSSTSVHSPARCSSSRSRNPSPRFSCVHMKTTASCSRFPQSILITRQVRIFPEAWQAGEQQLRAQLGSARPSVRYVGFYRPIDTPTARKQFPAAALPPSAKFLNFFLSFSFTSFIPLSFWLSPLISSFLGYPKHSIFLKICNS